MKVWNRVIWILLMLLIIVGITVWPVMAKLIPPPTPDPYGKEKVKPNPKLLFLGGVTYE